jgi:hypothetical protein
LCYVGNYSAPYIHHFDELTQQHSLK